MAIDVEVGFVAVHPLADGIGQPADGEDVCRTVERERIVLVSVARQRGPYREWGRAAGRRFQKHAWMLAEHCFDDIAAKA